MARSSRRRGRSRLCQHPEMDHREFWHATSARLSGHPCSHDWRACRWSRCCGLQGSRRDPGRPSHASRCAAWPLRKPFPDVPGQAEQGYRSHAHPPRQDGRSTPCLRREPQIDGSIVGVSRVLWRRTDAARWAPFPCSAAAEKSNVTNVRPHPDHTPLGSHNSS